MNTTPQTEGADPASDTAPIDAPQSESKPPVSQTQEAARRLRELLATPERDRSDAVWDEIISLEIELAPGNRVSGSQPDAGRVQDGGRRQPQRRGQAQGRPQAPSSPANANAGNKPARRFFKRSRRGPGAPQGKR